MKLYKPLESYVLEEDVEYYIFYLLGKIIIKRLDFLRLNRNLGKIQSRNSHLATYNNWYDGEEIFDQQSGK